MCRQELRLSTTVMICHKKFDPKEQVVVPTAARKVLKGIFDGLDLLRDLEEEKRIERGRDIRSL